MEDERFIWVHKHAISKITRCVALQAEDEGLWHIDSTAPEAYLQEQLRHLHSLIETFLGRYNLEEYDELPER